MATNSNARGLGTAGAKDNHESATSVAHDTTLTRDIAEVIAWTDYATEEHAVVELVLLAYNASSREQRFRALCALEWFDPTAIEEPARPALPTVHSDVEDALGTLRWVLYGWAREARIRAAHHCGAIVEQLAEQAS